MKKIILSIVAMLLISTLAFGQWEYVSDLITVAQPHAVLKTADGKVWVGSYAYTDTIDVNGTPLPLKPIWVYNADGSVYGMVRFLKFASGDVDTLVNGCRGASLDNDGNILYSAYDDMWRINYQTFDPATYSAEAMGKVKPKPATSLTEAAVDENGFVYLAHVGGGNPCYIFDSDLQLYSYVADTIVGLQRSILVSPDGKDVFFGKIYSGRNGVIQFHSDDGPDGIYTAVTDTLGTTPEKSMWAQCLDWDPAGMMWVGTYWDVGAADFTGWYALDPMKAFAIGDSIGMTAGKFAAGVPADGGTYYSPRGITFWDEGGVWNALTADFDAGVVKQWKNANPYTGVISIENGEVVRNYSLLQNYPNPFNPTTTIPFTLAKKAFVELKVYDIQGREVMTLVNKNMEQGQYNIPFDATGFATGTYFYRLKVDGQLMTKSMTLVK